MSDVDREIRSKSRIPEYAEETGSIGKTCHHFGIPLELTRFRGWLSACL